MGDLTAESHIDMKRVSHGHVGVAHAGSAIGIFCTVQQPRSSSLKCFFDIKAFSSLHVKKAQVVHRVLTITFRSKTILNTKQQDRASNEQSWVWAYWTITTWSMFLGPLYSPTLSKMTNITDGVGLVC